MMVEKWIAVCDEDDLIAGSGLCALHQGDQVAIFRDGVDDQLYAVSNYDPLGEANVISRGIVGSIDDTVVVASPLYKQHFCLRTGTCLEDDRSRLKTYAVRRRNGTVELRVR